jgi:uncharacterized protein
MILDLINEIITIFKDMAPYLFLGLTIAGILDVFFDKSFILKHLGKNNLASVIKASVLGVPIPLCSCGVIPTAISLKKSKASQGAVVSFLISTPQTGVDSIAATYGMMGPVFAIFRPIVSFVMGIVGGVLTNITHKDIEKKQGSSEELCESCQSAQKLAKQKTISQKIIDAAKYAYFDFLDGIAVNLVVGMVIAGFISFLIPDNFFTQYLNNEFLTMLLMIVAGVPLYICATASIPVAVSLILKGISPGAAFVFLAVGPATNAATITVLLKELGRKVLFIYLSVIIIGSLMAGYILNAIYNFWDVSALNSLNHAHHAHTPLYIEVITWLFLILLGWSIAKKIKRIVSDTAD